MLPLLQREKAFSLKSLSIAAPNSFCFELSQMFSSPICAQKFSCSYPETNKSFNS